MKGKKNKVLISAFSSLILVGVSTSEAATVAISESQFLEGASVIDFEDGNTTALPTVEGVSFVQEGLSFRGSKNFSGYFGEKSYSNLVSADYTNLGVEFDNPQQAVGAWVGQIPNFANTMPDYIRFAVYGDEDNLLGEAILDLPQELNNWVFAGFASDEGISRIEWLGDNQGFFGVDNITYGVAEVPVPASWVLFSSSLILLRRMRVRA